MIGNTHQYIGPTSQGQYFGHGGGGLQGMPSVRSRILGVCAHSPANHQTLYQQMFEPNMLQKHLPSAQYAAGTAPTAPTTAVLTSLQAEVSESMALARANQAELERLHALITTLQTNLQAVTATNTQTAPLQPPAGGTAATARKKRDSDITVSASACAT